MKINIHANIFRGTWVLDPLYARDLEMLVNNRLLGINLKPLDRNAFFDIASDNALAASPGQPKQEKKIIKIPMRGFMPTYGDWFTYGADDYLELFRMVNNNDSISGVVLDIDGPGSSIDAINMMKEFAEERKKPFVALSNTCCSGHFWTASLICDHHMAYGNISPTFGSIGVLSTVLDDRAAMEKEGYKVHIIRAPQSTSKSQIMVDYYAGKDEEFIKALEDEMAPMAEIFINDIKTLLPNIDANAPGLFTGSTFNAADALKYGLIHSIGNEKKAFELAMALAELNNQD